MIPYRTLGSTSERVSAIGIGGYHLGAPSLDDSESVGIVRRAIDEGVSFLDNSWDYCDGRSELRMGKALRDGYRQRAFLPPHPLRQLSAAGPTATSGGLGCPV